MKAGDFITIDYYLTTYKILKVLENGNFDLQFENRFKYYNIWLDSKKVRLATPEEIAAQVAKRMNK